MPQSYAVGFYLSSSPFKTQYMELPGTFSSWKTYYDHVSPRFPGAHEMVHCTLPEKQANGTTVEKSFPLIEVKRAAFDELYGKLIPREDFLTLRKLVDAGVASGTTEIDNEKAQQIIARLLPFLKS